MKDLFECPELLPENVQTILSHYNDLEIERGIQYADLMQMSVEMAKNGYSFDFYLDGVPYNLHKIKAKFHLLLGRSEYTADNNIAKLELLLKQFAISEGEKTFKKSDIVPIKDANDYMKKELWIEDDKYNGENVTFIHWYNEQFYIIQTN